MFTIHILSSLHDNMELFASLLTGLQSLDLSAPETRVYLALLELGPQPASVIAKKADLKRGHTYNMLHLLTEKGMVQEYEKDGTKYFTASTPSQLPALLERKEEELEAKKHTLLEIIPELERLRNPQVVQPKVRFFQGIDGIRSIYEDTLHTGKDIYAVGDFDHYFPQERSKELNDWMWDYCKHRANAGITYIGIINQSRMSDLGFTRSKEERRSMKMLQDIDLPVELNIYGNKVAIISSSKDMVGLILEDKPTADTLRNFHQAVWQLLPDYSMLGS